MKAKVGAVVILVLGLILTNRLQAVTVASDEHSATPTAPALSAQKAAELVNSFHRYYYDSEVWKSTTFLGIPTLQNPNDAWIIEEIICDVKPDFIVDSGTYKGGSAALWATALAQVNPTGRVITIDIMDRGTEIAKKTPIVRERVDFLMGSSTAPEIVAEVEKRVKGKKVMLVLDSLHTKKHVLSELKAYSPLISVGSYIVVEDTDINGHPVLPNYGPGPMEAVQEFLAGNPQFVADRAREHLIFTMFPNGFLKRVK